MNLNLNVIKYQNVIKPCVKGLCVLVAKNIGCGSGKWLDQECHLNHCLALELQEVALSFYWYKINKYEQ